MTRLQLNSRRPGVPSWLKLAPDGTLIVEPPVGVIAVNLPVEVVDSTVNTRWCPTDR